MEKNSIMSQIQERLAEYKIFYPDTTVTTVSWNDGKPIPYKDGLELSKAVCQMTHSGLLEFSIFFGQMYIFKSKEFLKVADGFKKGARIRFYDPRTPALCHGSVMLADGMRYDGGIPFIWTEGGDADCFEECNTFAVYWRPVEEDRK